jgi:tetratricopeptide (TPR) repeat protein
MRALPVAFVAGFLASIAGCGPERPKYVNVTAEPIEDAGSGLAPFGESSLSRPHASHSSATQSSASPPPTSSPVSKSNAAELAARSDAIPPLDMSALSAAPGLAYTEAARLAAIPQAPTTFEQTAKSDDGLVEDAMRFYQAGRVDEAIAMAQQATARHPDDARGYELLGICYVNKGELARAVPNLDTAIRKQPKNAGLYTQRGVVYARMRFPNKAEADFDRAIEISPRDPVAFVWRAIVHFNSGKPDKAIADATQALEINDKIPDAYFVRCLGYLQTGRRDEARKEYEAATAIGLDEASRNMVRQYFEQK